MHPVIPIHQDYNFRPLAVAVIVQAVRDARDGQVDAVRWLLSHDAAFWFDGLGQDWNPNKITYAISSKRRIPAVKIYKQRKNKQR